MATGFDVRRLGPDDESLVLQAEELFDNPPQQSWVAQFLRDPTHHLFMAFRGGRPSGFVSAVELTHPDKGTEMFLYELAVAPADRRQGVATALLRELTALARRRGCYDMWVLTDDDNIAALNAYRSSGATREGEHVMLTWEWADSPDQAPAAPSRQVRALVAHQVPDRNPLHLSVGERVEVGDRDREWPEFVFVTAAHGSGWVPSRHLSNSAGTAIVETAYNTTELPTEAGEVLEVVVEDSLSGWLWCRSAGGREGWVPSRTVEAPP
ncbi:MAG: GNAT family N-acetyltransferase [Candidatus Dormibacteria bacterium]